VVDDQKYLWMLIGKCRFIGNAYSAPILTIGIDSPVSRGQVLQCRLISKEFNGEEADADAGEWNKAAVRPKDVERVIREAIRTGWIPQTKLPTLFKMMGPFELEDYIIDSR
jgi:hypothetical protein